MPNSFATEASGVELVTSGMDPVMRWDGLTGFAETAGVVGPTVAPAIAAGTAFGSIVGSYQAAVRFVDRLGNYSNISPISDVLDAKGATGFISNATNATPIVITSQNHGLVTGQTVQVSGVGGTTGANGTFVVTVVDANNFSLNNSTGNADYTGSGQWVRGVSQILYTNVATPSDAKVVRRQLLRTTDGQASTFYVDIDTTDLSSTSFTSTTDDTDLSTQQSVPLTDENGNDLAVAYYTPPPNDRAFYCFQQGRMFAAGVVQYMQGAVAVTLGSSTVTGIGTEWTLSQNNRALYVEGATRTYYVTSINLAAQTASLIDVDGNPTTYRDATNPYANYTISPAPARMLAVDWSNAGLPEACPPTQSLTIEQGRGEGPLTGMINLTPFLYILKTNNTRRLVYSQDPDPVSGDGAVYNAMQRGMVNFRSFAVVEGGAYILDASGIYLNAGNDWMQLSQLIQDIFDPQSDFSLPINWTFSSFFHCVYDPSSQVIRWFVSLDGNRYPHHAIAYQFRDKRWWIEEFTRPIASSIIAYVDGSPQVFLGTDSAQVICLRNGALDGPDPNGGTTYGTVTSCGLTWLADSAASYGVDLANAPLFITDGTGAGQQRRVVEVDGNTIYIDQPWLTMPDTTSVYQVGGIAYRYKPGTFRLPPDQSSTVRQLAVVAKPVPSSRKTAAVPYPAILNACITVDRGPAPLCWSRDVTFQGGDGVRTTATSPVVSMDLTKPGAFFYLRFDSSAQPGMERARYIEVEFWGVKGPDPARIFQAQVDGATEQ